MKRAHVFLPVLILTLLVLSMVFLIAVSFIPVDYSLYYGFGFIDNNEGGGVEQGFSLQLHNDIATIKLKQMIQSIKYSETESVPEYGECYSFDIARVFGQHDIDLIVYSPEHKDYFFHNKNGWHVITDPGPIRDMIQESIYNQAPFGFRYEMYESHIFMPVSHLYYFSGYDSLWEETRYFYKGDGFEHQWNGKIECAEDAFLLAKSELGYTNAAATWCFSPDGDLYDITIVSMDADLSSSDWWKAENNVLFNVIVGSDGIIREIYSFSTFGFLDPTYLDYKSDSFSWFVDKGIVLVG